MCGIAGIVNRDRQQHVDSRQVLRMCNTLTHRGPDDEGIFVQGPVGLGMRRLSIIDVTGGHQPIYNEDRTVWVVFNGEIYNFPELRSQLEGRGHHFYTSTDTEVIVHLYEEYGTDCVQHLRGMFGFALYDLRKRLLLLARDRLGIKPLHYALNPSGIIFGSEIKAILAVSPERKEIDRQGLLYFFYFGYIPEPKTCFSGIRKLPAGHRLVYQQGQVRLEQYWDVPAYASRDSLSEEDYLKELESLLAETVRSHLLSDVPLGALLSGGVDSSIVVALMARLCDQPVRTFSIGFRHADFDESSYAGTLARVFHTEHHELILQPDIFALLNDLTSFWEEPFADPSTIPNFCVSQLARQHVTVALSGDGGDELFGGYNRYRVIMRRRIFDLLPGFLGKAYRKSIHPHLPEWFLGRRFSFSASLPFRDRYLDELSFYPVALRGSSVFSRDFLAGLDPAEPLELFRSYYDTAPAQDPLSRILYLDTKTYLTADILAKVDRTSMANSLEIRPPLLDHRVVEWAAGLSSEWKLRRGESKYLLKRLARRLGVPAELIDRPKHGFSVPLVYWFRNEFREPVMDLLLDPLTLQRGYFNASTIRNLLDEHFRGRRNRSGQIWALLIFELWHRNFLGASKGYD